MKKIALPLIANAFLFLAACSDNPPKDSGQDQVPVPVQNSGPETEAARANTAVQDSSQAGDKKDSVATSNHHAH